MASDAINVLIHLNVLFSIRQKQDFSHSVIPFPPTSQIRIFYHYTNKSYALIGRIHLIAGDGVTAL